MKIMDDNNFGKRLKGLRLGHKMTQVELASKLGISASAIGMYEQGRREPDNKLLSQICTLFNSTTDYLLGLTHGDSGENKEVDDVINEFTSMLISHKGLMFNGEPVSDEDKQKIVSAIRVAAAVVVSDKHKH
ncbi:MAG: helix-turn-helix domain-containing protein [Acutalibacteraceae bacterium]